MGRCAECDLETKAGELHPLGLCNAVKTLRELYPDGAPEFTDIMLESLRLHSDKNHDYASGGDPMGNFDRVSAIFSLYPGLDLSDREVVALVYMMKQVDAVLWHKAKKVAAKVEGQDGRLADIAVYASLVRVMQRRIKLPPTPAQQKAGKK